MFGHVSRLGALAALGLAASAGAAGFHPAALVAAVEDLYNPTPFAPHAPSGFEADSHILVREAHKLIRSQPDSDEAAELKALFRRPELPSGPSAPGGQDYHKLKTPHFVVLYKTSGDDDAGPDGDRDGVPDKARWVADAFELAYKREVEEMGYPAPPDIPEYVVVLKRLKVNALTHPEAGGRTWCEFNFAMREGSKPEQIRSKIRAVAAHEFFHAIQATLNWNEADWWVEGSSDWMSELVDPGNHFFHANARLRLESPEIGLESDKPFMSYAGSLFSAFLSRQKTEGRDLLKETWLACGRLAKADSGPRNSFIKQALTETVGPFDELVNRFWPHVYLRNFPGGAKLPRAVRVRFKKYPGVAKADTLPRPDRYGANFFEFWPESETENRTLVIRVVPESPKAKLAARVLAMGKKRWESHPVKADSQGVLTTAVSQLGPRWRAVMVSVTNLGKKVPFRVEADWKK